MKTRDEVALLARAVISREDFEAFVQELRLDLFAHDEEWENPVLERYLAALGACVRSIDGYYKHMAEDVDLEQPSWNMFARLLFAASVYE